MPSPLLQLSRLCVSAGDAAIVRGIDLTILPGEVHAVMGPNGSGKSTFVSALAGHPGLKVTGEARFDGHDLLALLAHERALKGLFLAFQYPRAIAGVSVRSFLLAAHRARAESDPSFHRLSPLQFDRVLRAAMERLRIPPAFADRSLNEGFSGGEKKKAEVLQMMILRPRLALLDETDSGLDVDALKVVGEGIQQLRASSLELRETTATRSSPRLRSGQAPLPARSSFLVITHYARILDFLAPDRVHVMIGGRIVESGGPELARQIEREGYRQYGVTEEGGIMLDT